MSKETFNKGLLDFINASPTPFHAVDNMCAQLLEAGFQKLQEGDVWNLQTNGRYFVTRNDSSIIAFRMGDSPPEESGFRLVGAHTDSPCLKLKPNPVVEANGYVKLGVEVYGGVLLNPWFDRDLSLAGRLTLRDGDGKLINRLVDFREPVAIIPSLAIHLDREVNENRSINKQTMLPPVLALSGDQPLDLKAVLKERLGQSEPELDKAELLDFELSLYDIQPAGYTGLKREFIAGARLDNLLSCYAGLRSLLDNEAGTGQLLVCNDHEEVGSGSAAGARGNFLRSVLERISGGDENYARMTARSMLVSTDNAHGLHPNFTDKHDEKHGPLLNAGPAVKVNSNQAYASNSETAGLLRHVADRAEVSLQAFVSRADMACGSTIGPLTATELGVRTVDVGVPTFAMHSIRELAGSDDAHNLYKLLLEFNATKNVSAVSM
ncbi:MAG: M18 family aminopeptidase [Gammaproteobacteria bacterium]